MVKHNRFWMQTHYELQDIIFKLIQSTPESKITIRQVCKATDINRSTFYNHYLDILDLIEQAKKSKNKSLINVFRQRNKEIDFNFLSFDAIKTYLEFLEENGAYYKVLLNTNMNFPIKEEDNHLYKTNRLYEMIKNLVIKTDQHASEREITYYLIAFQSSLFNITKSWALDDYQDSADNLTRIIINSLPNLLYQAINNNES